MTLLWDGMLDGQTNYDDGAMVRNSDVEECLHIITKGQIKYESCRGEKQKRSIGMQTGFSELAIAEEIVSAIGAKPNPS